MIATSLPALVVDDFETMTRVMKVLLQGVGFEDVDVCHDGETALRMLKERHYGLVISDLEMEPVSGLEFVRRARADISGQNCVILLTTASRESAARARRDGAQALANDIILKPFTAEDLKARLITIAERPMRGSG
jgi:two-component system chemotaxis response regulator CheY